MGPLTIKTLGGYIMEKVNNGYEFMHPEMKDIMDYATDLSTTNIKVVHTLLDMVVSRMIELYPDMEYRIQTPQELMGIQNANIPGWFTNVPKQAQQGKAEFKWSDDIMVGVLANPNAMDPTVAISFIRLLKSPMMHQPMTAPVAIITISAVASSTLVVYERRPVGDPFITELVKLYQHMVALPAYAKDFGIFKEVD